MENQPFRSYVEVAVFISTTNMLTAGD